MNAMFQGSEPESKRSPWLRIPILRPKKNSPLSLEARRAERPARKPRLHHDPDTGEYSLREVDSITDFTESLLWTSIHRPVKIDHTTLIVRAECESETGRTLSVFLKRSRPRNWLKAVSDYFRPDRSRRAARCSHALAACGVSTARTLWTAGPRRIPSRLIARESYLALEWLPGTENLHLWIRRLLKLGIDLAERLQRIRACAEQAGRLLGRMHAAGISHRDLKATNLLIHEPKTESIIKTQTGLPDLWLIDMDGVRISRFRIGPRRGPRRLSHRHRVADLARLAVSVEAFPWITRSIRAVFLRAYASEFHSDTIDIRRLWHDIARVAKRRLKQKRRRGKAIY